MNEAYDFRPLMRFVVPGEPIGKGRPRFTREGRAYTPKKTATAESMVAMNARLVYADKRPVETPVHVEIEARFAMPKSWSDKKRREDAGAPCTKRPDADNIAKLVCDSLNGIAWADDSQVATCAVWKNWAETSEVIVRIYEMRRKEAA